MPKRAAGLLVLILVLAPCVASAQKPVVYAVLFFKPLCPHCRLVIDNDLPLWQQEFGDQFKLVMVDSSTERGRDLYVAASETPGIEFSSFGVPVLIIGKTVIIGDVYISKQTPTLIREGLAKGGIELPPIPGLREAFATELAEPTVIDRLAADPIANGLAVGVLLALVLSTGAVLIAGVESRRRMWVQGRRAWVFALITSLVATGLASTLFLKSTADTLLLSGSITLALLVETIAIATGWRANHIDKTRLGKLVPLGALVGLAVAAYLSSTEMAQSEAVCGLVGDCNAVQQSLYARLFGVLPIGILGVFGYLSILLAWLLSRIGHARLATLAQAGLRGLVLFGVLLSIYLTFLEPFVIGATCIWCLTSAVIMLLLLWLIMLDAEPAIYSVHTQPTD
jgi:uncharacterized membrane protein